MDACLFNAVTLLTFLTCLGLLKNRCCFGGCPYRHNLEFHQIVPVFRPALEERHIFGFYELIADFQVGVDPARDVVEAIGHHPAFLAKSAIDGGSVFELLDYHVQHRCFCSGSYFSSSFVSAKALTANSKSSRECAALTCVRTRAVPCGTTG